MAKQKSVDLERQGLTEIPDDVMSFTTVEMINVRHNKISELPPNFGHCFQATLKRLWLWCNRFTDFPEVVLELVNLEILDLRENAIRRLPPGIARLQKLQKLWLCENQLESLPDSVCEMDSLIELMAHRNNLSTLPLGFGRLKLKFLNLNENPLIQPPLEVCQEGIRAIAEYQRELEEARVTVSVPARLKIVVLGQLMAGKTSLVAALTRAVSRMTREEARTHCLEVKEWVVNVSELSSPKTNDIGAQEFVFEVYDVGGHDTYSTVHPFFITEHALQLLIVDLSEYKTEDFESAVGYWIRTVSARVPGAIVCVVGTKVDKLQCQEQVDKVYKQIKVDIDRMLDAELSQLTQEIARLEKVLKEPFDDTPRADTLSDARRSSVRERLEHLRRLEKFRPRVVLQNTVSSSEQLEGIAELRNTILSFANNRQLFPNVKTEIPKSWALLLQLLKSARAHCSSDHDNTVPGLCLPFDQVKEMGKTLNLTGENLNSALSYLHETGRILHYKDSPSLRHIVFHSPIALVRVLRAVQHHDVSQLFDPSFSGFDYLSNSGLQRARDDLDKHGLVRTKELKVLLRDHVCSDEEIHAVLSLVEKFGLCHRLGTEEMSDTIDRPTEWYRFPRPSTRVDYNTWSEEVPEGVEELQIGCCVLGSFPTGLFQRLCSNAHKFLQYRWDRDDRVLASTGTRLVHLQHRRDKQTDCDHITMATRGQAEDASDLWAAVLQVQHELELLLADYPVIVPEFYVTCHHCLRTGVKEPHRFPGSVMKRSHAVDVGTVKCSGTDQGQVNTALVLPPHEYDIHVSGLNESRPVVKNVTNINNTQIYEGCQFGNENTLIQNPSPDNDVED